MASPPGLAGWWARQPRLWVCVAAIVGGAVLTLPDGRPDWTVTVLTGLVLLSGVVLRLHFVDCHPDWVQQKEERAAQRLAADADAVLARYQASRPAPPPGAWGSPRPNVEAGDPHAPAPAPPAPVPVPARAPRPGHYQVTPGWYPRHRAPRTRHRR